MGHPRLQGLWDSEPTRVSLSDRLVVDLNATSNCWGAHTARLWTYSLPLDLILV